MKTTSTKQPTSAQILVTLSQSDLETARLKALAHLASSLKIAGFRKGKAPANIVEKHADANQLSSETLDIAVRTALPKAFAAENIQPLSIPHVDVKKYVPGDTVEFTATADIMPEIKLGNYRKLKAKRPTMPATPADVTDILNRIASSFAEKKAVKRKAQSGDEVIIDFTGKKDDTPFEGGSAKDYKYELGSNQFIPGFEEGIIGHEPGDKFNLPLTFPKNYHNTDLAGAKVIFEVLVKQVNAIQLPKIDDALAQKSGAFKTLKDLKADIKKNLQAQNDRKTEEEYKDNLVMELVKTSKVQAPESLLSDQLRFIRDDLNRNLASHGTTMEQFLKSTKKSESDWESEARVVAENRVKASLVLQALSEELRITVSDTEVTQKLSELKQIYKKDQNLISQLDNPQVQADIKNRLKIDKTLESLVKVNNS